MKIRFLPAILFSTLLYTASGFSPARAATTLTSLASDASVTQSGVTTNLASEAVTVGRQAGSNLSAVFVFQLPTLQPGETVANASFTLRVVNAGGSPVPTSNLDLYGLAYRSEDSVLPSDYYSGERDTSPSVTFLADSFRTPSGSDGNSIVATAALTDYINAQIADGATSDSYIFLRVSSDAVLTSNAFYYLGSSTNTTQEPQLTFDIVPEPATLTLLPITAMVLFFGRRRGGIWSS